MYEPSRQVSTFFIAGFKNYDGAGELGKLAPGKKLKLRPEPDNPHDPDAVALYRGKTKLGYVPRGENGLIALLSFYGHADVFECRVLQVDKRADPWKQVRVGVFVCDAR